MQSCKNCFTWASACSSLDKHCIQCVFVCSFVNPFHFWAFLLQTATSAEIRKAYRRLSLVLHPDKSKEEDAEAQFRQVNVLHVHLLKFKNKVPSEHFYFKSYITFSFKINHLLRILICKCIFERQLWHYTMYSYTSLHLFTK